MTTCGKPAGRAGDEVAVGIGREQRQVADMDVGQVDAEHVAGLRLHLGPGGQAAVGAVERLAGGDRPVVGHPYSRRKTWCDGCEV